MHGRERAGFAALFALALIWGYTWIVIKVATASADAFTVSALRCVLGAACLFVALVATRRPLRPPSLGPTLAIGLLQTTGFTIFQTLAVAAGGAGKTAILAYTMPFWTVLFAALFLRERIERNGWIALALAAVGLAFVAYPLDVSHDLFGKAAAVVAGLVWGASVVVVKHFRARHEVEPMNLTAWQLLYGAVPLAVVAIAYPRHHIEPSASFFLALAYLTILGTATAWLLWTFVVARLAASAAGIGSLVTPVAAVLMAWGLLGERPDAVELLGIMCIIGALVANALPKQARA